LATLSSFDLSSLKAGPLELKEIQRIVGSPSYFFLVSDAQPKNALVNTHTHPQTEFFVMAQQKLL
jgi:hypothetical protein